MSAYQFQLLPALAATEYDALKADIAINGVMVPVEVDQSGAILDGHHRVRAWTELTGSGVELPDYPRLVRRFDDDESRIEHALKLNLQRRHLTREQLKQVALDLRQRGWSYRRIGDVLAVSHEIARQWLPDATVNNLTVDLPERVIGKDGKSRPATRPQPAVLATTANEQLRVEEYLSDLALVDLGNGELLTSAQAGKRVTAAKRQERDAALAEPGAFPNSTYRVLYADPPWQYSDQLPQGYGGSERHYPTMRLSELQALPVYEMAADDAVLFLWSTSPMLPDALSLIVAWGFAYKASFVWDKVKHNYGHYNSVRHEFLLLATRGSCLPDAKQLLDSVQVIERTNRHSEKPEEFRQIIDTLYPPREGRIDRLELFRRGAAPANWHIWGNESEH